MQPPHTLTHSGRSPPAPPQQEGTNEAEGPKSPPPPLPRRSFLSNKSMTQESKCGRRVDRMEGWWEWMGKAPVQACAHTHTHTRKQGGLLSLSCTLPVSLSLGAALLRIITCLLSQCQSLGRRQRDIGKIILWTDLCSGYHMCPCYQLFGFGPGGGGKWHSGMQIIGMMNKHRNYNRKWF